MLRLMLIALGLSLFVASCGSTTPRDDSDPAGAYRASHGRTYG